MRLIEYFIKLRFVGDNNQYYLAPLKTLARTVYSAKKFDCCEDAYRYALAFVTNEHNGGSSRYIADIKVENQFK